MGKGLKGAPHVVQIEEAFFVCSSCVMEIWIIMERFQSNLFALTEHHFKNSQRMCRHAMFQVLQGLRVLHDADIVHRDVKPYNVLATLGYDPPKTLRVALCDFGTSRSLQG